MHIFFREEFFVFFVVLVLSEVLYFHGNQSVESHMDTSIQNDTIHVDIPSSVMHIFDDSELAAHSLLANSMPNVLSRSFSMSESQNVCH